MLALHNLKGKWSYRSLVSPYVFTMITSSDRSLRRASNLCFILPINGELRVIFKSFQFHFITLKIFMPNFERHTNLNAFNLNTCLPFNIQFGYSHGCDWICVRFYKLFVQNIWNDSIMSQYFDAFLVHVICMCTFQWDVSNKCSSSKLSSIISHFHQYIMVLLTNFTL